MNVTIQSYVSRASVWPYTIDTLMGEAHIWTPFVVETVEEFEFLEGYKYISGKSYLVLLDGRDEVPEGEDPTLVRIQWGN